MQTWNAELASPAAATLGEGPLWDERTGELLWVDILARIVHRLDPVSGVDRAFDAGRFVGTVVPRASGGYVLAVADGFAAADDHGRVELLVPVDADDAALRMNDGACDSRGRFWAGTMRLDEAPGAGALYRLDPNGTLECLLRGVTVSNGIAWSPDDTLMYFVDSPTRGVDVFDYEAETGAISGRRRLITLAAGDGFPDGLVVDLEGAIWLALWDGWEVRRYAPDGRQIGCVPVPVARVTKPAFGGSDLADLYITTASPAAPDPAQPAAGGVFVARPGVRGLPASAFAG